jgi:hypothetical protein
MTHWRIAALLAALWVGIVSLSGCAVEHRRDGGFTVRPLHVR